MGLRLEGLTTTIPLAELPEAPHPGAPAHVVPAQQSDFSRLFRELGGAIDRGEALLDGAARGTYQSLDASALIALQAGIYRYSEAIDLTSKLVERVTNGARTILQAGH
jgi:hypothetical protein